MTAVNALAAAALETALNAYFALDEDVAAGLQALDGKLIRLRLEGPGMAFRLRVRAGVLRVDADTDTDPGIRPDLELRATPAALLRLARGEDDPRYSEVYSEVYFQGDAATARTLQRLLGEFEFDGETLLAGLIGELPASQIGGVLRSASRAGRRGARRAAEDLGDYLRYDRMLVPARREVERFCAEIAELQADCERLEARLRRLDRRQPG